LERANCGVKSELSRSFWNRAMWRPEERTTNDEDGDADHEDEDAEDEEEAEDTEGALEE